MLRRVLECVVNISEGRDGAAISSIAEAAAPELLDVHTDADHHRTVLTTIGEDAPRRVAAEALARVDLRDHAGAHPRLGVVDVVPFVPLGGSTLDDALAARDGFASWLSGTYDVPGMMRLLRDVGSALSYLHDGGQVHGSVTTETVWAMPMGRIWLLGWQWAVPLADMPEGPRP